MGLAKAALGHAPIGNESVPKITINNTINVSFLLIKTYCDAAKG